MLVRNAPLAAFLLVACRLGAAEEILSPVATIHVDPAGARGSVDGLAFSGDGRLLAASDNSATARLYDLLDPWSPRARDIEFRHGAVGERRGHLSAGEMNAVLFSPDGRWLAGGVDGRGLRIWEAASGRTSQHLDDGSNTDGAAFSPDGRWLASAADNRVLVRPFDTLAGTAGAPVLDEAIADAGEVNSLSWSGDGLTLAAAGLKVVVLYRQTEGAFRRLRAIPNEGRSGSVKSVRISPDGDLVAIGARDERARVFDLDSGEQLVDLPHDGNRRYLAGDDDDKNVAVEAVAWSTDGQLLFTSGLIDGVMRVWRRDDWSLVDWRQADEPLRAIEFIDVRGDLLAVGGDEGVVRLYRVDSPPLKPRISAAADGFSVVEAEDHDDALRQGGDAWRLSNGMDASGGALVTRGTRPAQPLRPSFDPTRDAPKLDYRLAELPAGSLRLWARVRGRCELRAALGSCAATVDHVATLRSEDADDWQWVSAELSSVGGDATLQLWPGPGEWIEVDRFVIGPANLPLDLQTNNGCGPAATPRRQTTTSSEQVDE